MGEKFHTGRASSNNTARMTKQEGTNRRILIVEDDPFSQKLFSNIVKSFDPNIEPIFAESCEEAENSLRAHPDVDLIILDVFLNDEDRTGLDLYETLARFRKGIPIVITSAISEERLMELLRQQNLPPLPFLHKPFRPELCAAILASIMK